MVEHLVCEELGDPVCGEHLLRHTVPLALEGSRVDFKEVWLVDLDSDSVFGFVLCIEEGEASVMFEEMLVRRNLL